MTYPGDPNQPPNHGSWQGPPPGGGHPGYGPPTIPPKRTNVGLVVLAVVLVGIFLFAVGTAVYVLIPRQQAADAEPSPAPSSPTDIPSPTLTSPEPTSSAADTGAELPEEFDGQWSGEVTQYNPDGSELLVWDLKLDLKGGSGTADAELDLPDGDCTWNMVVKEKSSSSQAEFSWELASDPNGVCAEKGALTVVLDDETNVAVRMETEFPDGTSWAEGTLKREDA